MKTSLVSATAFGALLAFEAMPAQAQYFTLNQSLGFGDTLVNCQALAGCAPSFVKKLIDVATLTVTSAAATTLAFGSASSPFSGSASSHSYSKGTTRGTTQSNTYTFAPTVTGSAATTITAVATVKAGKSTVTQRLPVTLTGTGVAPVASIANGGNYALVGNTGSVMLTVRNTGNGNLSGDGSISNLRGTIAGASGLFTGSSVALGSGAGLSDGGTRSISYTFKPTTVGTFSTGVTGNFADGLGNTNSTGTLTATLSGTGVAPAASVGVSNPTYVLVKSSATATVTVNNTGNGNLAGADSSSLLSNLHGTQGAASSSVFTGSGGSVNLQDSTTGVGATTSSTYTYNFAPTASGAASTAVTTSFVNGVGATNGAGSTTVTLTGTGVAPINSVTVTNTAGAGGSAGTGNLGYLLVTSQTGTATITLSNIGNGNLAGSGGAFNLNGSITNTVGTGFTGGVTSPTSSVSLNDSHYAGAGATLTQAYSYTFAPTTASPAGLVAATTTLTSAFSNGSNDGGGQGLNNSQTVTTVVTATGVAPIQSVSGGSALSRINGYGYASNSGTGTAAVTVQNTGHGNLSGLGSVSNLNVNTGSISLQNSGSYFSGVAGNSASLSLGDASTSTLSYVYTPVSRGTNTATVTIAFANGNNAGTNLSQTVEATVTGQGVGPTYQSTFKSAIDTPTVNGGTAHASNIAFGTLGLHTSETLNLYVGNISTDPGGNALTDLTLVSVSSVFGGTDPLAFTIGSYGTLLHEGGTTYLPITVTANETGTLTGDFTITTDEGAPLGFSGDTFTYALNASAVPEPASLVLLGIGLAGVGFARRRRAKPDAAPG